MEILRRRVGERWPTAGQHAMTRLADYSVGERGTEIRTDCIQRDVARHIFCRRRGLILSSRWIVPVSTGFDRVLDNIRNVREEIVTGECLDRVDRRQVSMPIAVDAVLVWHDHRDRSCGSVHA